MSYTMVEKKLTAGDLVYMDGATGSELHRRGAPMHPLISSAMATMTNPEVLQRIHEDYIRAGCDIIVTNSFLSSRNVLAAHGLGDEVVPLTRGAVEVALRARDRTTGIKEVAIAGSMSHALPMQAGTTRPDADKRPSDEEMQLNFHETADILSRAGCDFILLERMSDPQLTLWAQQAAQQTRLPVWIGMSAVDSWNGELLGDLDHQQPFEELVDQVAEMSASACGVMHTHLPIVQPAVDVLRQYWSGPLFAYPQAGRMSKSAWEFDETLTPEKFARQCVEWADAGVQVLGGCCGITLSHIQAMIGALNRRG
ncbi:MAG: homocysteine S-methyltransferase family protein [Gammaproteobacteria bacterium]|nr:homocysteine S-methyltransferase family protein [Gammaproteobacteria bacterium]